MATIHEQLYEAGRRLIPRPLPSPVCEVLGSELDEIVPEDR